MTEEKEFSLIDKILGTILCLVFLFFLIAALSGFAVDFYYTKNVAYLLKILIIITLVK